jgi:hypothetical protein
MPTVSLCRRPLRGPGEVLLCVDGPDKKPSAQEAAVGTLNHSRSGTATPVHVERIAPDASRRSSVQRPLSCCVEF